MILADKIIKLRKKFGWSQEELAEKMNVSRQSVSKWESTNSIPDLNKIIKLGEIFSVSTDYLLKDEIEEIEPISDDNEPGIIRITLEQAKTYVANKVKAAKLTSFGVFIILSSVVPLFLFLGTVNLEQITIGYNTAVAVGLSLLFVMIGFAVSFFIRASQFELECYVYENEEFELAYGVRSIIKDLAVKLRPSYQLKVSISVMLFITSSVPLIIVAIFDGSSFLIMTMLIVLILMIAIGIFIIIPVSAEFNAYNLLIGEGNYLPKKKKSTKRIGKFAGVYWPLLSAIYLGWSLWTMNWGTTWILWPVAGVLFAAIIGLMEMIDTDEK